MLMQNDIAKAKAALQTEAEKRVDEMSQTILLAILQMFKGSRSGREYTIKGTNITYVASAPGEAPALRTGQLRDSWQVATSAPLVRHIGSALDYALFLELGTHKMEARPYILMAVEKVVPQLFGTLSREWRLV